MKKILILFFLTVQTAFGQQDFFKEGNDQLLNKDYAGAEHQFRKAIESDPDNLFFKAQLVLSLIDQAKSSEAEAEIQHILEIDKNFKPALLYGGNNSLNTKDYRKALDYYEKLNGLIAKHSTLFMSVNYNIGKSYRNLLSTEGLTKEQTNKMVRAFKNYITVQPNANDLDEITSFIKCVKKNRPRSAVKKWIFTNEDAQRLMGKPTDND